MANHAARAIKRPTPTTEELRQAVEEIDATSQEAFSEISAVARIALTALTTPAGANQLRDIARALTLIARVAEDSKNSINVEAETVGCNHVDIEDAHRAMAIHRAHTMEAAHV